MGVEKAEPQEQISGLDEDAAAGTLAWDTSNPGTQHAEVQDEVLI